MFQKLILYYCGYFLNEENKWLIFSSAVCISVLSERYRKWIKEEGIVPIENISEDEKLRFWNIAGNYHQDKDKRIMASQSAYALTLMTGNND